MSKVVVLCCQPLEIYMANSGTITRKVRDGMGHPVIVSKVGSLCPKQHFISLTRWNITSFFWLILMSNFRNEQVEESDSCDLTRITKEGFVHVNWYKSHLTLVWIEFYLSDATTGGATAQWEVDVEVLDHELGTGLVLLNLNLNLILLFSVELDNPSTACIWLDMKLESVDLISELILFEIC